MTSFGKLKNFPGIDIDNSSKGILLPKQECIIHAFKKTIYLECQ